MERSIRRPPRASTPYPSPRSCMATYSSGASGQPTRRVWCSGTARSRSSRRRYEARWQGVEGGGTEPDHAGRVQAHVRVTNDRRRVNAKPLSTYMGHANISVTLDRYGHLMPGNEAEATGLLDA